MGWTEFHSFITIRCNWWALDIMNWPSWYDDLGAMQPRTLNSWSYKRIEFIWGGKGRWVLPQYLKEIPKPSNGWFCCEKNWLSLPLFGEGWMQLTAFVIKGYEAALKILLLFKIWNNLLNFIYINTCFLRIIIIMIMSSLLWYLRVYTQLAKALLGRSLPFRLRLFIYYCTEQQTCTVGTWTWLVDYFDPLMIIVSDKILKITPLPAVMYTWKQWGTLDTTCPSNSNLTRCWSPSSHKGQHAIIEEWLQTPAAN